MFSQSSPAARSTTIEGAAKPTEGECKMRCNECKDPIDIVSIDGREVLVDPWRVIVKPATMTREANSAESYVVSGYNTTKLVVGTELVHGDSRPGVLCRPVHECEVQNDTQG